VKAQGIKPGRGLIGRRGETFRAILDAPKLKDRVRFFVTAGALDANRARRPNGRIDQIDAVGIAGGNLSGGIGPVKRVRDPPLRRRRQCSHS